jgi:prophage regulatory protein
MSREVTRAALPALVLLRLPQVLELIPVSRSTWWAGVKSGRFPAPIKIGPRTTAWRAVDIRALVERLSSGLKRSESART